MSDDVERIRQHIASSLDVDVRSGYRTDAKILERLDEQVRDEFRKSPAPERDAEAKRWREEALRQLAAHRELEATWTETTHNDRIDAAFAELRSKGIVALQDAGYTMSDGWEDVHDARARVGDAWGATFFHRQDVERAVDGGGLMLAYGAFVRGEQHEPESLRVAQLVCDVLAAHGVPTTWDGTIRQRVHVSPFEWRKRRWTTAPT